MFLSIWLLLFTAIFAAGFKLQDPFRVGRLTLSPMMAVDSYQPNKGSAAKGEYIPDGLTKEQYANVLKAEQKEKEERAQRFPKGKVTESLTEWLEKEEKKGNVGAKLLKFGHRMVKPKYKEFISYEPPF